LASKVFDWFRAVIAPIHGSVFSVCACVPFETWVSFVLFTAAIATPIVTIESWASLFYDMTIWASNHTNIMSCQDLESRKLETIIFIVGVSGDRECERSGPAS